MGFVLGLCRPLFKTLAITPVSHQWFFIAWKTQNNYMQFRFFSAAPTALGPESTPYYAVDCCFNGTVYSMEWSLGAALFEWSGLKFWRQIGATPKVDFWPLHNSAPRLHDIENTELECLQLQNLTLLHFGQCSTL